MRQGMIQIYCGDGKGKTTAATGLAVRGFPMAFCKNCGNQIEDNAATCPNCGASQNTTPQVTDNGGFLWGLLGCCIPIVGLVLFLVWKDTKPKTSKATGIGALVGVILMILYYILIAVVGVGFAAMGF